MDTVYILRTATVISTKIKSGMLRFPTLRPLVHRGALKFGTTVLGTGSSLKVGEVFYRKWKAVIDLTEQIGFLTVTRITPVAEKVHAPVVAPTPAPVAEVIAPVLIEEVPVIIEETPVVVEEAPEEVEEIPDVVEEIPEENTSHKRRGPKKKQA